MILDPGSRVLVAQRRLFELDHTRFFAGVVDGYEQGIARVRGYTWMRDGYTGDFEKKPEERTKIISIASGTIIVYELPRELDIEALHMTRKGTHTFLGDGRSFSMDLTEGVLHSAPTSSGPAATTH